MIAYLFLLAHLVFAQLYILYWRRCRTYSTASADTVNFRTAIGIIFRDVFLNIIAILKYVLDILISFV